MSVLATVANMRRYQRENKTVTTPEGETITIESRQPFAYSPNTDERCSATPGDYFMLNDDEPLTDSDGEPMVLVTERCELVDVDAL